MSSGDKGILISVILMRIHGIWRNSIFVALGRIFLVWRPPISERIIDYKSEELF